jgi:hypothetical protein
MARQEFNSLNSILGKCNLDKTFYIEGFEVVILGKCVDFHIYTFRKLVLLIGV